MLEKIVHSITFMNVKTQCAAALQFMCDLHLAFVTNTKFANVH